MTLLKNFNTRSMNGELWSPESVITVAVNNVSMLSEFKCHLNVIPLSLQCSPKAACQKTPLLMCMLLHLFYLNYSPAHHNILLSLINWKLNLPLSILWNSIPLFILNLGTTWRWVVNIMPQLLYPGKETSHCIGGLVDPWASLDILEDRKISCPCWDSNPWIV